MLPWALPSQGAPAIASAEVFLDLLSHALPIRLLRIESTGVSEFLSAMTWPQPVTVIAHGRMRQPSQGFLASSFRTIRSSPPAGLIASPRAASHIAADRTSAL